MLLKLNIYPPNGSPVVARQFLGINNKNVDRAVFHYSTDPSTGFSWGQWIMNNFTVRQIDVLPIPSKGKRTIYYDRDVKGLALRLTSTGTKTFLTIKRVNGKKVFTTLGHYPSMTIQQARKQARTVLNIISDGINPNNKAKEDRLKKLLSIRC